MRLCRDMTRLCRVARGKPRALPRALAGGKPRALARKAAAVQGPRQASLGSQGGFATQGHTTVAGTYVPRLILGYVHGFGWHFACRQMSGRGRTDQLLSLILIIVQMPEPDYFLRYHMHCNVRNFITSGKSHIQVLSMVICRPSHQRRLVLRHRKTVVGGNCTLPSAVLVTDVFWNEATSARHSWLVIFFLFICCILWWSWFLCALFDYIVTRN